MLFEGVKGLVGKTGPSLQAVQVLSRHGSMIARSGLALPQDFFVAFCLDIRTLTFVPTNGFSITPLKAKLVAGEQKATETCPQN